MLVSIPFEPDDPLLQYSCGDCTICVDGCPTSALVGNGQLNSQKCISFLTKTKGYMPDREYRYKIGNRLYGCDTCDEFYCKNRGINPEQDDDFKTEILKPRLVPLLRMSNDSNKHMVTLQVLGMVKSRYNEMLF